MVRLAARFGLRGHAMRDAAIIAVVAGAFVATIHATNAAYLPLKPKPSQERVADQKRERSNGPTDREQLFQQFLEWLRSR
jgi:hypothetical protein